MKISKIDIPESNTEITLNVSDTKASEILKDLEAIGSIFNSLQNGDEYYAVNDRGDYVVCINGEYRLPILGLKHSEWNNDDNAEDFETNSLIHHVIYIDGKSYMTIDKKYAERIINDQPLYDSDDGKEYKGKLEGLCDVCMEKRCEGGEIY